MVAADLLADVKKNLNVTADTDDAFITGLITAAISYAESYQHLAEGYYGSNAMPHTTRQGIVMLSSHLYESRDGSTGGFFADNVQAGRESWDTVNTLLRLDRVWSV